MQLDEDRCQSLRWKGLFVLSESSRRTPTTASSGHKTHQCIGPDAKIADDYECNETRGCYEAL